MHARSLTVSAGPTVPIVALALSLALALGLAGCGGGDDSGVADTPPTGAPTEAAPAAPGDEDSAEPADGDAVLVQGFRFQPDELTVARGATVTWTNEDDIRHTATSGAPGAPDGVFAVSLDGKGTSGSFTSADAGTYAYFCEVHNSMLGTVVVTG